MESCKTSPVVDSSILEDAEVSSRARSSYGQILKSSALIGGSTLLNVCIGIARTKAMALLLGPVGFGLMGLYSSIFDLVRSVAGMGVSSSGVRQIAEAVGSDDETRIVKTAIVLRRVSIGLGLGGACMMLLFSIPIARISFGSDGKAGAICLLSLAVLFRLLSDGQGALLQGMRRIADMAKISLWGSLLGTTVAIPLIYWLREDGVVPALVAIAVMTLLISWGYSRKAINALPVVHRVETRHEAAKLLKLGLAFMGSGLLMMGAAYVVRILIVRGEGLDAAGFYQAAWTLGGIYIGFILQAMGADFYPRLTAVANDHEECNRLVNEQALVSLLLAGPGILGTLTFAPWVISLFYSNEFQSSVPALRWICLGMTLRVVNWPIGFIIVAKGAQGWFFWSELFWAVTHVLFAFWGLKIWGVTGAGIAFFGAYLLHGGLIYAVVRNLSGFHWAPQCRKSAILLLPLVILTFLGFHFLPTWVANLVGISAVILSVCYSFRLMSHMISREHLPPRLQKILRCMRLASSAR